MQATAETRYRMKNVKQGGKKSSLQTSGRDLSEPLKLTLMALTTD